MSGSANLNDDYDFLPANMVINFDDKILNTIWNKQIDLKKDKKEKHIFIIFDDCLATPEAIRNNIMNKIWVQGRHLSISSAILTQYPAYVTTPTILGNSDLILYSKLNRTSIERLYHSTTGLSMKDFLKISEAKAGLNYTYLVINNYCKSPDWKEWLTAVRADFKKPGKIVDKTCIENNEAIPDKNEGFAEDLT